MDYLRSWGYMDYWNSWSYNMGYWDGFDDWNSFLMVIIGRFGRIMGSCFGRRIITTRAATMADAGGCGRMSGFSFGDGGEMLAFRFLNFEGVHDGSWADERCDIHRLRGDGQSVRQDAESSGIGYIADSNFFSSGIEVSPATYLVTPSVTKVGSGLARMSITE